MRDAFEVIGIFETIFAQRRAVHIIDRHHHGNALHLQGCGIGGAVMAEIRGVQQIQGARLAATDKETGAGVGTQRAIARAANIPRSTTGTRDFTSSGCTCILPI